MPSNISCRGCSHSPCVPTAPFSASVKVKACADFLLAHCRADLLDGLHNQSQNEQRCSGASSRKPQDPGSSNLRLTCWLIFSSLWESHVQVWVASPSLHDHLLRLATEFSAQPPSGRPCSSFFPRSLLAFAASLAVSSTGCGMTQTTTRTCARI
jgi:hypothetical protein